MGAELLPRSIEIWMEVIEKMKAETRRATIREFRKQLIKFGSPTKLARHLGISRQAVYARMCRYGIDPNEGKARKKVDDRVEFYQQVLKSRYMDNEDFSGIATRLDVSLRSVADVRTVFVPAFFEQILDKNLINQYSSNIRVIRLLQRMSQTELAQRAGLQQEYISEIESGRRRTTNKTLSRIAEGLGVELRDLLRPLAFEVIERSLKEASVDRGNEQSG